MTDKIFNLQRFKDAQRNSYAAALSEIRNGKKRSHWMWYIFPQVKGLGMTSTSIYYSIESLEEAKAYLKDNYLGGNLVEICQALLDLDSNNASAIFGFPDDMKLRSSMTLFDSACEEKNNIYSRVIDKFYNGIKDDRTLDILGI